MKKYLMTWYGTTDFSASIGIDKTTGPVLGALLAEDYTDLVILGFTRQDKTDNKADEFKQRILHIKDTDQANAKEFIDMFLNTAEAHVHFNQWIEKQLLDIGKKVEIHFISVGLKYLNDTEGIYEAANQALDAVAALEGEKMVTLYLSPGTPVMAFVWAFAALRYPTLKKRLIASSQPGKPPEKIILPNEWMEWHGRQVQRTNMESDQYDVIFHLFGEQRMPNLLGVIQFSSRKHIFVNSVLFPADVMKQFLGESEYGEITVDPYDPENVRSRILDIIAKMPANLRIGFNLTGGTKLMYAGALAACRKVNGTPFYFESQNNLLIYLNNFSTHEIKLIDSVETVIRLNSRNVCISDPGMDKFSTKSEEDNFFFLTELLWDNRENNINKCQWKEDSNLVFFKDIKGVMRSVNFKGIKHWYQYKSGHWLEDYVFLRLKPLFKKGLIRDLRSELKVRFNDVKGGSQYQEFDVVFTDGIVLYVIECKSSSISGNDLSKLSSVTREFGGVTGKGILFTCRPSFDHVIKQKAKNLNILLSSDNNIFMHLEEMLQSRGQHR